jgi:pilus assembly protein Flp/PilA
MLSFYVCARNFLAQRLVRDDRGATAVEYGLILAAVAAAIGVIAFTLGGKIATAFTTVSNDF